MSDIKDFQIEKGVLTAYHGAGGDIVIPEGVTHIKIGTFEDDWNITGVTLPDSMTEVGYWAFCGCKNLKSVHLPDTIQKIGGYAFMNCENLVNINIPESVKTIGDYAFISCKNLRGISLPRNAEIGCGAFVDCAGLADENGRIVLNDILYGYIGESLHIEIPENITEISAYVFRKYDLLKNLTVFGNVKIGRNAFSENLWLEECTLAKNLTDEEEAKQLIGVIGTRILAIPFLKNTLETNPVLRDVLLKRMILKQNRSKLIPLLLEKGENTLFARLLSLVPKMPADEIDSYIKKADGMAEARFLLINYKKRLYPPEILDEMESIQMEKDLGFRKKTIADHQKLFTIRKVNYRYLLRNYKGDSPHVIVPAMIGKLPVELCDEAFVSCPQIETVYIEDGIQTIPDRTFDYCPNLRTVSISQSVTHLGQSAFASCTALESVTGAEGLTEIGYAAFNNCGQLQDIMLPAGLKTIGGFAFNQCWNLRCLVLSESITEIGQYAFEGCTHLTICAPIGSYAETYAKTNHINFHPQ
ncbi:MAG: leucine-rich repeat domain-containing protein [Clostridia bacterium]|nr:leucine-rich repeat domain-containing protein [Clostridia bacterium]